MRTFTPKTLGRRHANALTQVLEPKGRHNQLLKIPSLTRANAQVPSHFTGAVWFSKNYGRYGHLDRAHLARKSMARLNDASQATAGTGWSAAVSRRWKPES
jgi:hypothetical protein